MGERGLLVGVDIQYNREKKEFRLGKLPNEFALNDRRWLLFWDRIGIARNGNMVFRQVPDIEFLASTGQVEYFDIPHSGGEGTTVAHEVYLHALYELEDRFPGQWAIDRSPGSLFAPYEGVFPRGHMLEKRGGLVELVNVIPIPDVDAPIEDLLRFKEHRRAELLELRHTIDDLYDRIGNAADPAHALNSGLEKIEAGSAAVIRTLREQRLPFRMSKEMVNLNVVGGLIGAIPSIIASAPIATVLGNALAGAVTIGVSWEWLHRKKAGSPYEYISLYHREVFRE
ncbi:DUF6236 family protein [Agrobacterium vitis]|uniref:DUF6236 family protein n=1 Tax=Agrobacterium vitis TaxID=373 RepID=UPI00203561D5|nr:DUF6236 family protein [Agrobacterium vitis]MCM2452830.1 hypothetical protein [Agrobacterium vitis]